MLLCIVSLLFYVNKSVSVLPTVSNTTGEYYLLSYDSNYNKEITCNHPTLCYIECTNANSCETSIINATATNNLTLQCNGKESCKSATISAGPQIQADIYCTANLGSACSSAVFIMDDTPTVNLKCDNDGSTTSCWCTNCGCAHAGCEGLTLWTQHSDIVTVDCQTFDCWESIFHIESVTNKATLTSTGRYGLFSAEIHAANANELEINCNNDHSCYSMDVYPPYQSEYAFSLYCVAEPYSCGTLTVTIPNSYQYTTNYMELNCPQTNRDSTHCNVRWDCEDLSSLTTATFDTELPGYKCSGSSANNCCPWSSSINMIKNKTTLSIIPFATIMTPTITNTSGEYYILTSSTTYKPIYCQNIKGCYIECIAESSCASAYIYAGQTNYLTLICSGKSSCSDVYITEGPMIEANIYCTANLGSACTSGVFIMDETHTINLQCDNDGSTTSCWCTNCGCAHAGCEGVALWAQNSAVVTVDCQTFDCWESTFHMESVTNKATLTAAGSYGLFSTVIYAANANELEINCNNGYSCRFMDVYPPYQSEYVFSLYCAAKPYSCGTLTVTIPDSYQYFGNYMELNCPQTNRDSTHCSIQWDCLDLSSVKTATFDIELPGYKCSESSAQTTLCCPWSSPINMVQNQTTRAIIPLTYVTTPTNTNSSGEYYILTSSTSYKAIYCQNIEGCYIECSAESSCASAYIYAGQTNYLTLICSGKSSCSDIYITEGPLVEANIYCTANLGSACSSGVFIMDETPTVNLQCDNDGSTTSCWCTNCGCEHAGCEYITLWAQHSDTVTVNCQTFDCWESIFHIESVTNKATLTAAGRYGLFSAEIHAVNANELEINCNNEYSCYQSDIFPPYQSEYAFSLRCNESEKACDTVDITVPDSYEFTINYMELQCGTCDIGWICLDRGSSINTVSTYNNANQRFECDNKLCCPWEDFNFMTKPTTISPTKFPTISPSEIPTAIPTQQATKPTISPIASPTFNPTHSPTNNPTAQTNEPTFSPTFDILTIKSMQYQPDLDSLERKYRIIISLFIIIFGFIAIFAYFDAKCIRKNDYFNITQISGIALQTMDMLSDCFFATNVSIQYKIDSIYFIPLLLSIFFIIFPATITIIQLWIQSSKHWIHSSDQVREWLAKRSKTLYLLSVFSGNSFVAVSLVNSYMFKLSFFDMGLSAKELNAFGYKRVYSIVILENVPQLLLQSWFLISLKAFNDPIIISSIIFSLISIIVSILSMLMQKQLSQSQGYVIIGMKITGNAITQKSTNCKTLKQKLEKRLALLVGVHNSCVEIIKPTPIKQGFEIKIHFYFGDLKSKQTGSFVKIEYAKILIDAQKNGQLQLIFQNGWKLKQKPIIEIISYIEIQSKSERKKLQLETQQTGHIQMVKYENTNDIVKEIINDEEGHDTLTTPKSNDKKGYGQISMVEDYQLKDLDV